MSNTAEIARAMATTMENAAIPMYGKKLRLPDRSAIIALLKELRRLFFPAYFGDPQLMALPAENYAALLLERIETGMTAQIALALPDDETAQAAQITESIMAELPRIQQMLLTDIEATFDGDPAAANKEEIIFAYPGLFAIFVYRIAHELYLRHVPMIPRIMSEYAHSRTGIDIHPGAQIGDYFFIDYSLQNKTKIAYDIEELRVKLTDKKETKATNSQTIELTPVYSLNPVKKFKKNYRNVLVIEKLTFPDEKVLRLEISENQISGRVITLTIEYEDILNADGFDSDILKNSSCYPYYYIYR